MCWGPSRSGGTTADEHRAELAHVDVAQLEREITAAKEALARAVHDVTLYRSYRANGIGSVTATLLTVTRAATDIV